MEDVREFTFLPLVNEKLKPSNDQLDAIDDLITSLTNDALVEPESKPNPYYQYLYQCLTHRALQPGRVLPEPDEFCKSILAQPEVLAQSSRQPLERVAQVFKLEQVLPKKEKLTGQIAFGIGNGKRTCEADDSFSSSSKKARESDVNLTNNIPSIDTIGSVTPVEDFSTLLKSGLQFGSLVVMLEKVILKLVSESFGDQFYVKITKCLRAYRDASLERKVSGHYNSFLQELKSALLTQGRPELWQKMMEASLNLISVEDDPKSSFSSDEAREFSKIQEAEGVAFDNDAALVSELIVLNLSSLLHA